MSRPRHDAFASRMGVDRSQARRAIEAQQVGQDLPDRDWGDAANQRQGQDGATWCQRTTWRQRCPGRCRTPNITPGVAIADPLRTRCTREFLSWWRARQESNLYQELRKLSFYPLNYGRSARRRYCTQFCAICMKWINSSCKLIENPFLPIGRTSLTPLYNPAFACRRAGLPPTCAVLIFCCRRQAPPVPVSRIWS